MKIQIILALGWLFASLSLAGTTAHPEFACEKCHTGKNPTAANPLLKPSYEKECYSCHKKHSISHSAVVKTPSLIADQFPLDKGKIGCVTCHEEAVCRDKKTSLGPGHLRGGPYKDVDEFCRACHKTDASQASGKQIHFAGKEILSTDCFTCHLTVKQVQEITNANPQLKLGKEKLCLNCHKDDVHPLVKNHVGRKPDFLGKSVSPHKLRDKQMILDDNGEMICLTCHEPHGEVGAKEKDSHKGILTHALLRGNGSVNQLCQTCHTFD